MDHLHSLESSRAQLEQALALNTDYAAAWYNLGNLGELAGLRDEAGSNFEKSLQLDPSNQSALARLADTRKFARQDDPLLARLAVAARKSRNSDVHFALGRAYEQMQEFDLAWRHFSQGNALDERAMQVYKPREVEAQFAGIQSHCTRQWLEQFTHDSAEHVFICGMFRSGSTLLEQMLGSHPAFTAGGERQFFPRLVAREFPQYPQGLADLSSDGPVAWRAAHAEQLEKLHGKSGRITDKRPDNFLYLGLIKAVLPAAKFVVTERDWRDIATSIYSVRLGPGQTYATRLENIRHYIRLQAGLIDHWAEVLGADLRRIRYEDLVTEPERTMTGLLEWLGETWDESCLSFHQATNSVQTASVWQVREPIHGKSVGRWRHYERYFAEAFGNDLEN